MENKTFKQHKTDFYDDNGAKTEVLTLPRYLKAVADLEQQTTSLRLEVEGLKKRYNEDTELISKLNTIVGNHQQQNATLAVDIIKILEKHWTFDNSQGHTHSWHDKQDCIKEINLLL